MGTADDVLDYSSSEDEINLPSAVVDLIEAEAKGAEPDLATSDLSISELEQSISYDSYASLGDQEMAAPGFQMHAGHVARLNHWLAGV